MQSRMAAHPRLRRGYVTLLSIVAAPSERQRTIASRDGIMKKGSSDKLLNREYECGTGFAVRRNDLHPTRIFILTAWGRRIGPHLVLPRMEETQKKASKPRNSYRNSVDSVAKCFSDHSGQGWPRFAYPSDWTISSFFSSQRIGRPWR